jgi:branched-chain amino acid transport system substrate-binding protein
MPKLNPYIAGNPVGGGGAFIGRADVLREVLRVLRNPHQNALVLYGQRRIGKTSVLQELAARLPDSGPYQPVYFDLQDKATWPLGRVLQLLAQTIAQKLDQPAPNLDTDPETAFRAEWLPFTLTNLPDRAQLVLLFDEFDVLADPNAEQAAAAFFPYLRDLLANDPQRLDFVFVVGRNVDDLDNIALSLFKGIPSYRVSLLNRDDTLKLVRLSEANHTLHWPDEAAERVYQLTNGHPFLTQQLCYLVWEQAYEVEPDEPPTITPAEVDAAIPGTLASARSALEWLWNGLPPAERVVASALAEAGPGPITQEALERLLRDSGVRVIIRDLQNAPQLLQAWDLIEPAEGGYCFRVELLRQWLVKNKPLRWVQEELSRTEPVAESLYQAAVALSRSGQLEQAVGPLCQAINLNPNHLPANNFWPIFWWPRINLPKLDSY